MQYCRMVCHRANTWSGLLRAFTFSQSTTQDYKCSAPNFLKAELEQLLVLAQSDRERELIQLATFQASGLNKTSARRHSGFENISNRLLT